MSSHHIVRDEQEPALLLLSDKPSDNWLISNLLEWSPTVITTSNLVEKFISLGIKIDVVLCPLEEIDNSKMLLVNHSPIKLISYCQEDSLIDITIFYLRGIKHTALNVISEGLDLSVLTNYDHFKDNFNLCFYYEYVKWYRCRKSLFRKWVPQGRLFYLLKPPTMRISLNEKEINYKTVDNLYEIVCEEEGFLRLKSEVHFWLGERIE